MTEIVITFYPWPLSEPPQKPRNLVHTMIEKEENIKKKKKLHGINIINP